MLAVESDSSLLKRERERESVCVCVCIQAADTSTPVRTLAGAKHLSARLRAFCSCLPASLACSPCLARTQSWARTRARVMQYLPHACHHIKGSCIINICDRSSHHLVAHKAIRMHAVVRNVRGMCSDWCLSSLMHEFNEFRPLSLCAPGPGKTNRNARSRPSIAGPIPYASHAPAQNTRKPTSCCR